MTLGRLEGWVVNNSPTVLVTDCVTQRFCREVAAWRTLRHPNVLPLLGVTMTKDRLVMVSEWMANGTINEYVERNVNADRLGLVCFQS